MANRHIVRERETAGGENAREVQGGARGLIVSDIMGRIEPWRKLRDGDFEQNWDEYYAKWRGFWMPQHKSYKSERSKLIAPLTSMSIDLTAAEIVEAVLGREYFIDIPDDVADQDTADVEQARAVLVADMIDEGFINEFAKTTLNGCLYGNGIMKVQINVKKVKIPHRTAEGELKVIIEERVKIKPVAIEPGNFVADPAVDDIDDMVGCAHEFLMPIPTLRRKQSEGQYYNDSRIGPYRAKVLNPNRGDTEDGNRKDKGEAAFITEYYGLIPKRLLSAIQAEDAGTPMTDEMLNAMPDDMVEVIATIANETHLLRVIENPLITGERLMMAYQHELVPGRFYGRGVAEKGMNIQRAMDAEMRGRIDALAWANAPMFAFDLTRMPPGSNMNAWPGKAFGTRGNPSEVMQEFRVSGPDQNSYAHMQELERMGQQATGALDTAGLRGGVRDETATGSALAASSFIKRSKRTMFNIEGMLNRLVRRVLRLKMQYDPQRYPQDYEFRVRGTLGMMAREIEQNFMVGLLSVIGPDSQASMPIIRAIFEHSGSPVKGEVLQALRAMEEQKPSPEEEAAQAAQLQIPVKTVQKLDAEIAKLIGEAEKKGAETDKIDKEVDLMDDQASLETLGKV
ncbi:MAG: portal protein, partial [Planctomycetota bacterium]